MIDLDAVRAALDAAAERRRDRRPDRARQGPRRQGPERARLHRAGRGHRHRRQPRRGPQDAVRLPRHDAARGLVEGPRHRRRGLAAAVRPRRRQRARHGAGRLERRAAACCTRTARRCRASTTASRCARACTRTCTSARSRYGAVDPPREVLRTPAIGDIDGDLEPEIVDSAGEHVYAWEADGSAVPGLPGAARPGALAAAGPHPQQPHQARLHRVAGARRPERGRRPRDRGRRRSTSTSTSGTAAATRCPASRRSCATRASPAPRSSPPPRSATSAATASPTSSRRRRSSTTTRPRPQTPGGGAAGGFSNFLTNFLANVLGGSGRVYAVDRNGNVLPGWPTAPNGIVPDALPFVGPGVDHILANVDGDPELEAIGNVASGDVTATNGDGSNAAQYDSEPAGGEHVDKSKVINLFENPIAANIDGVGGPGDHQGRRDAEPGREPRRRRSARTCPTTTSCRPGTRRPAPRCRPSRRRSRTTSCCPARRSPTSPTRPATRSSSAPASTTCATSTWPASRAPAGPSSPAAGSSPRRRSGDADGDGDLEVTTLTREGFGFMWDTDQPACGTNDEWWTSRHDEWNTGAYGTDSRPPGTPHQPRRATRTAHRSTLTWTAPGDDWLCGTAQRVPGHRARSSPIEHPERRHGRGRLPGRRGRRGARASTCHAGAGDRLLRRPLQGRGRQLGPPRQHVDRLSRGRRAPRRSAPRWCPPTTSARRPNRVARPAARRPLLHPARAAARRTLTVGTPDANGVGVRRSVASLRLDVMPGDPSTTADEADVAVAVDGTDVRCAGTSTACPSGQGSDYTGKLLARASVRITDKANGPGEDENGTMVDTHARDAGRLRGHRRPRRSARPAR